MHAEVSDRGGVGVQMLIGPHQMAEIGHVPIQVRRDHVLEDSMQQLHLHLSELRKPLRITFLGGEHGAIKEEAVDEGVPPPPACERPCRWLCLSVSLMTAAGCA